MRAHLRAQRLVCDEVAERPLERARLPVRPGEYVVMVLAGGIVLGALGAAIGSRWFIGVFAFLASPLIGNAYLERRIRKRRQRFEAQFPEALTLIARARLIPGSEATVVARDTAGNVHLTTATGEQVVPIAVARMMEVVPALAEEPGVAVATGRI